MQVEFDDKRGVCDAGIALVATLALRLGIDALAREISCGCAATGPGPPTRAGKVIALLFATALGADSIDDSGVLRAGRTGRLLGGWMPARRRL